MCWTSFENEERLLLPLQCCMGHLVSNIPRQKERKADLTPTVGYPWRGTCRFNDTLKKKVQYPIRMECDPMTVEAVAMTRLCPPRLVMATTSRIRNAKWFINNDFRCKSNSCQIDSHVVLDGVSHVSNCQDPPCPFQKN